MTRPKKLLIVFIAAAACCIAGYVTFRPALAAKTSFEKIEGDWVAAKKGTFEIVCREEGELRPIKVTSLSFLHPGKVSFLIPEGTIVRKGDRIIALETEDLEEEITRMQEDLALAEKNLAQQQQQRDLDVKRLNTELLSERDRTAVAKLKEREVLARPIPVEKEQAKNTLAGAEARVTAAKADLEAIQPLVEKGFGTKQDLSNKQLTVDKAVIELERAKMRSRIMLNGALPYERERAALDREQAEISLRIKEIDCEDQTDALNARAVAAERAVTNLKIRLERRKLELERSTIEAPHDGIVVFRPIDWRGNKKIEVGERVVPSFCPVELPNYEKMKVRTLVPESFIRNIRARVKDSSELKQRYQPGSKARVTVKTQPDKVYHGEVTWIDGWARDRNSKLSDADVKAQGLSGVRIFDVEVELEESDPQRLREGFRAIVEFPIETLQDVVSIPLSAVTQRDGGSYVQVKTALGSDWRKVNAGQVSNGQVVITAGLDPDEKVLAPKLPPEELDTSKEKKPIAPGGGFGNGGMRGGGGYGKMPMGGGPRSGMGEGRSSEGKSGDPKSGEGRRNKKRD